MPGNNLKRGDRQLFIQAMFAALNCLTTAMFILLSNNYHPTEISDIDGKNLGSTIENGSFTESKPHVTLDNN